MKNANQFPMWVFNGDSKQIVGNEAELAALGEGWHPSPAGPDTGEYTPPESETRDHGMSFPMWAFHKDGGKQLIQNAEEAYALGEGWSDSPAGPFEAPAPPHDPPAEEPMAGTEPAGEIATGTTPMSTEELDATLQAIADEQAAPSPAPHKGRGRR